VCAEHVFDLDPTTNTSPLPPPPPDDIVVTLNSWEHATSSWSKDEDLVVTSIPSAGLGLEVTVTPFGAGSNTLNLFAGEQVLSAFGQFHDGELYVVAILDNAGTRQVVLAYGEPGSLDVTPLNYNAEDLPSAAAGAEPAEVALFVDDDRIAVAMTMVDFAAGPGEYADAVGWVFLGPPQ
jgi:hypothetical protein